MSVFRCCDSRRRSALRESALNGIDYLEVRLDTDPPTLVLYLVKASSSSDVIQLKVEGGTRVRGLRLTKPKIEGKKLSAQVDRRPDFSTYTLRVTASGFDPLTSEVDFVFRVHCLGEDCAPTAVTLESESPEPEIDYLAKDYSSFRRLMLDRMAALVPDWQERSPADVGITLVELLAYVGDQLSYRQDAIATEAYLDTARRRVSVRRHVRLVDYPMNEGCNARVWVHLKVADEHGAAPPAEDGLDAIGERLRPSPRPSPPGEREKTSAYGADLHGRGFVLPRGTPLLTRLDDEQGCCLPYAERESIYARLGTVGGEVFETLDRAELYPEHNELHFYTWGGSRCVLRKGARRATLRGRLLNLKPGDVLMFAEQMSPATGAREDADPSHRHAIRLTNVQPEREDPLGQRLDGSGTGPVPVTEVEWAAADALPFALSISAETREGRYLPEVSIALGNVVPADHGRTIEEEDLGEVPAPRLELDRWIRDPEGCAPMRREATPPRYRPRLGRGPLTFAAPIDSDLTSARLVLANDPTNARPRIELWDQSGAEWQPQRDLLGSGAGARDFRVEMESDGTAWLGFGDDYSGQRPLPGTRFRARYRVGNGLRGNIGADAIDHLLIDGTPVVLAATNPLPAFGGQDPEPLEDVRRKAPDAFRRQERAVIPADYARMAERHEEVQRAGAELRWTGSWHTIYLSVDRVEGRPIDVQFEAELRYFLEPYRRAGHDLEIHEPCFVPLEVELSVCVKPDHFRDRVRRALGGALGNRSSADGGAGLFHPDRWSFGQPVYLSRILGAVQETPGVHWVKATGFRRLDASAGDASKTLQAGEIEIAGHEIPRLDDDPSRPEHGRVKLKLKGGADVS